ncbi:MAG TPA: MFS transporter [Bryobacteraceae bacterium]|nr:MFS transporter [Bryobacteraceae bacterium]
MASPSTAARQPAARFLIWWPAIVMMLGTLLSYLDRQILALLSPTILKETHLSAQAFTETISAFSYAYMAATLIWGPVLDRIGLRLGMLISLSIWMAASASHAFVSTFLGFATARAVLGLGEGSMFPGGFRTAMDSLPVDKQARGIALAYSGSSVGSIIAPFIFIPIALAVGWRPAFLVTPALALIWLLIWRFTVNPDNFLHKSVPGRLKFPSFLERRFWSLVASYALGAFPVGAISYLSALYLSRSFGMTQKELGYVLWIPPAGLEAGYFFWGWVSDRFAPSHPRPRWLFLLMSALCLPLATITWYRSAPIAIALLAFTLFASGGLVVVTLRTGALAYPPNQKSMAAGIASSSFSAGVALLLPICGKFFDGHQYGEAFAMVAALPLLGTLLWLVLGKAEAA